MITLLRWMRCLVTSHQWKYLDLNLNWIFFICPRCQRVLSQSAKSLEGELK